jgi:branched-chain amino acid transport system permease protein
MAIGAYVSAYGMMQLHLPLPVCLFMGGLVTAGFGFVIGFPTLKLTGDYLAIVTLGFGEIIRVILINLPQVTGGPAGLKGIPSFISSSSLQPSVSFGITLLFVILTIVLMRNLMTGRFGRAIMSVRDDEIASRSMGVNVFSHKMYAFILSAFIAGIGGALYAPFFGYLNPTMFNFLKSFDFLIIVVLGGMGSITGTVIAGYALTYLQEFLRILQDYRLVIYPVILILIMLFRPGGLMGKREFSLTNAYFGKFVAWAKKRKAGGSK